MTVIVFVIDNSASMSQRTYLGTSLLDIAKGCVEDIYKIRLKFSRSDRYYIYTLDREAAALRGFAECKQNLHALRAALDQIEPCGFSSLTEGVRRAFDMLNVLRMASGQENYGQGRYPSQSEHAIVVCITDGGRLTSQGGLDGAIVELPVLSPTVPGHEYSVEPFRWDYRLYSIVLRLPALLGSSIASSTGNTGTEEALHSTPKFIATDLECPLSPLCELTGGRAYKITSERMLHQCLESLSQKCHPGVVLQFLKFDENNEASKTEPQRWHNCRKMIYVKAGSAGSHWPIPESFWPEEQMQEKLLGRTAHPAVCFSTQRMPVPRVTLEHFPQDKYELEPSPLTQYMLERRDSNFVWHCYVPKSGKQQDFPFGYLRPSQDLQVVHLHVLSYNFPALLELLQSLQDTFKMRVNDVWGGKFAHYLGIIPKYYFGPLSRAFERIGLPYLIKQESIERILPFSLKANLQRLRQAAKVQLDCVGGGGGEHRAGPVEQRAVLWRGCGGLLRHRQSAAGLSCKVRRPQRRHGRRRLSVESYLVPGAACRTQLRQLCVRAVLNYRQSCCTVADGKERGGRPMEREAVHEQPSADMGDYANYKYSTGSASSVPPLASIGSSAAGERRDTFGNPFRRKSPSAASSISTVPSATNNSNFEADERYVEDMQPAAHYRRPQCSSLSVQQLELGRAKGPLPASLTYYNWRRRRREGSASSSCSTASLSPPPPPSPAPASIQYNGAESPTVATAAADSSESTKSSTREHYLHNKAVYRQLCSVLRQPRVEGPAVFSLLSKFSGPPKLLHTMIGRSVHQALHFRRREMAELITLYLHHVTASSSSSSSSRGTLHTPPSVTVTVNGH